MRDVDMVQGAIIALGVALDLASDDVKVYSRDVRGAVQEEALGWGSRHTTEEAMFRFRRATEQRTALEAAITALEAAKRYALGYQSAAVEAHIASLTTVAEGDEITQEELERALSGGAGFLNVDEDGNKVPAVW